MVFWSHKSSCQNFTGNLIISWIFWIYISWTVIMLCPLILNYCFWTFIFLSLHSWFCWLVCINRSFCLCIIIWFSKSFWKSSTPLLKLPHLFTILIGQSDISKGFVFSKVFEIHPWCSLESRSIALKAKLFWHLQPVKWPILWLNPITNSEQPSFLLAPQMYGCIFAIVHFNNETISSYILIIPPVKQQSWHL